MKRRTWAAIVAGAVAALAVAIPALAAVLAERPRIEGDAVAGATLRAVVTWSVAPDTEVRYRWDRCLPGGGDDGLGCVRVADYTRPAAVAATYAVTALDVGARLRVRVDAGKGKDRVDEVSEPTAIVRAVPVPTPDPTPGSTPEPTASPSPSPSPSPDPTPDGEEDTTDAPDFNLVTPTTPTTTAGAPAPAPAASPEGTDAPLRFLRPFPVVRIRGSLAGKGADVTLLRVTAPARAQVRARCAGTGCPTRRLVRRAGRLRPFERYLPAGTRITIRVVRPGRIGKYARIAIRAGAAPARVDACALAGSASPVRCPRP